MALEQLEDPRPNAPPERHDPAQKLQIYKVGDTVGVQATAITEAAAQDAPQASRRAAVYEDNRVGTGDAIVERAETHCVDHPLVGGDECRMRLLPPRTIEVRVDHRKPECLAELAREHRLPGAAATDYGNTTHYDARDAASSRGSRRETTCETPSLPIVTP